MFFEKLETFVYKNLVVPLQGKNTFNFVNDFYEKGQKTLDFGCGVGSNSKLFHSSDYIGAEVDISRVKSSRLKYPNHKFEAIPFISSEKDVLPFNDNTFDIIFISLCLHHINSNTCKILFREFKRILKNNGKIIGLEPSMIPRKYFSNIFMNLVDAGDYILSSDDYKSLYKSEGYEIKEVGIVKTFGYHLWQYIAEPKTSEIQNITLGMTTHRKLIRPFHLISLYGKWVLIIYLIFLVIQFLFN